MMRHPVLLAVAGLCVGTVTSAGIFNERLTAGAVDAGVVGDIATTIVAIAVCGMLVRARPGRAAYVLMVAGAAVGASMTHAYLATTQSTPWMFEAPSQLVNDAVAALATLALIAAFARKRLRVECIVAATALVGIYAVTRGRWHLDHVPHGLATVQECVVAQFFSVLCALLVYRAVRVRALPS